MDILLNWFSFMSVKEYFEFISIFKSLTFIGIGTDTKQAVAYWKGWFKPPLNSEGPPKSSKSTGLWELLKIAEFWSPTPQDVWKKGSKIRKLLSVCNCFTLPMTNKLVVIINSLKIPKIKKLLLYEMKFLVPNCSCLQNTWLGATDPRSPFSLSSVLNWICWPPPEKNSWVRHCKEGKYLTVFTIYRFNFSFCLRIRSLQIILSLLNDIKHYVWQCPPISCSE